MKILEWPEGKHWSSGQEPSGCTSLQLLLISTFMLAVSCWHGFSTGVICTFSPRGKNLLLCRCWDDFTKKYQKCSWTTWVITTRRTWKWGLGTWWMLPNPRSSTSWSTTTISPSGTTSSSMYPFYHLVLHQRTSLLKKSPQWKSHEHSSTSWSLWRNEPQQNYKRSHGRNSQLHRQGLRRK